MKVLFVIDSIDFADHIAISYLSAIAKQLNHTTYICILKDKSLLSMINKVKPEVVAYSVNIMGYKNIIKQHKLAKKKYNFISIMGGPQATFSPETFSESEMDAYCIGEGEFAFRDFLIKIMDNESFDDVLNLITKKNINPLRPLIKNIDEIPLSDRDLTISNSHLLDTPKKTFYATRGCPYKCNYCCNSYYHKIYKGKGPFIRRFSVERIIAEIERVKSKYRTNFIKFGDDVFALNASAWMEEFSKQYSKRIKIPFNCFLRFDTVKDDLLQLLKEAGCHSVHLSVDSTSDYVREEILNRKMKKVNIEQRIRRISDYGIKTWVNYMLAVPCSTLEDDINTIFMSKKANVTYSHYTTTIPMRGTKLYDYCLENNVIDSNYNSDMSGFSEKSELKCFTKKEKEIRYNVYLLGALISKLPFPLDKISIILIKIIPPNKIFLWLRKIFFEYNIKNVIFKICDKKDKEI